MPTPPFTLMLADEAATERFARRLAAACAEHPPRRLLITLSGDLGAGKTTFTRAVLRAWGVQGRIKSPTFALLEEYTIDSSGLELKGTLQTVVYHIDLYRFSDPEEWEDAGLRDVIGGPGISLVEWPEHAQGLLPAADLALQLTPEGEQARRLEIRAGTPQGLALLTEIFPSDGPG